METRGNMTARIVAQNALAAALLMVGLTGAALAADEAPAAKTPPAPATAPAPSTVAPGAMRAPAPPPPAMVDDKAAAKANPHPVTNEDQKPVNLGDPELEPEVTIIERGEEQHEEVRINGVIRYIKVTPKGGPTYYLIPYNDGTYIRRESLDTTFRGPMWQLYSW